MSQSALFSSSPPCLFMIYYKIWWLLEFLTHQVFSPQVRLFFSFRRKIKPFFLCCRFFVLRRPSHPITSHHITSHHINAETRSARVSPREPAARKLRLWWKSARASLKLNESTGEVFLQTSCGKHGPDGNIPEDHKHGKRLLSLRRDGHFQHQDTRFKTATKKGADTPEYSNRGITSLEIGSINTFKYY